MKLKITFCIVSLVVCMNSAYSQDNSAGGKKIGETEEVKDKNINWEYFDSTSKFSITDIKLENIQGLWKAYKGLYKFDDVINMMNLTQPIIIEIKGDKYRRSLDSKFGKFTIMTNNIISQKKKVDFGIINKITGTELTITWKDGSNYTRYYYTR